MESLALAFAVVFPLFINMTLGYGLRRIGVFDEPTVAVMNRAIFKVFLPLLMYDNIAKINLESGINYKLLGFAAGGIIVVFTLLCLLVPKIEKDNQRRGVIIQGIFRSNFVLFGLPVATSICGEAQARNVAIMIAVVVPLFNILAVVSLEMFHSKSIQWINIVKGVITNPLIIGSALGFIFLLSGITLPSVISRSIEDLAKVATPLALIMLGASFHFGAIAQCLKPLLLTVCGRLIVVPGLFLPLAIMLGFKNVDLVGLLALFASPNAVSSFTMAVQMDCDGDLAGQIVVFTSIFSIVTMFIWISLLKHLGLI